MKSPREGQKTLNVLQPGKRTLKKAVLSASTLRLENRKGFAI